MHWKYNWKWPWDAPQLVLHGRLSGPHPCGSGLDIQNYAHLKHLYNQQKEQWDTLVAATKLAPLLTSLVSLGYQWPCSTASCCGPSFPASWPLHTTGEIHGSRLHAVELRANKQFHIQPNKYIIAHYRIAKIPNAAPTILNRHTFWLHILTAILTAFKSLQF